MYGMTAKRFDYDYYNDHKSLKKIDFAVGVLLAFLIWFVLFQIKWYLAPLLISIVSLAGILIKLKRRYFIYGALSVVFFPLVIWGGLMIVWAGKNEIKS